MNILLVLPNKELLEQKDNQQTLSTPDCHWCRISNIWFYAEMWRWTFFQFPRAQQGWLLWFPCVANGQRIYGNFKAKRPCQTRLSIWRKRTMFPWVWDTKPSFETKTSSLRSFQDKILEIYWCVFHTSERTKLKPGLGVLLSRVTISLYSAQSLK